MTKYTAQLGLTSAYATVQRSETLIDLAEESPELYDPLLGSAIVLLSTALEQIVNHYLDSIDYLLDPFDEEAGPTKAERLMRESLWSRVKNAPRIHPDQPFELNHRSDYVAFLQQLILRRNQLIHILEKPISIELELPEGIDDEDDFVKAALIESLEGDLIDTMRLEAPWREVTIAEARRSISATKVYLAALFDNDGKAIKQLTSSH